MWQIAEEVVRLLTDLSRKISSFFQQDFCWFFLWISAGPARQGLVFWDRSSNQASKMIFQDTFWYNSWGKKIFVIKQSKKQVVKGVVKHLWFIQQSLPGVWIIWKCGRPPPLTIAMVPLYQQWHIYISGNTYNSAKAIKLHKLNFIKQNFIMCMSDII